MAVVSAKYNELILALIFMSCVFFLLQLGKHGDDNTELNRKIVSNAFYWYEVEDEIRERGIDWTFKGNKEEQLDSIMAEIDHLRCSELYKHTEEDCSDICQKRGMTLEMMPIYSQQSGWIVVVLIYALANWDTLAVWLK